MRRHAPRPSEHTSEEAETASPERSRLRREMARHVDLFCLVAAYGSCEDRQPRTINEPVGLSKRFQMHERTAGNCTFGETGGDM